MDQVLRMSMPFETVVIVAGAACFILLLTLFVARLYLAKRQSRQRKAEVETLFETLLSPTLIIERRGSAFRFNKPAQSLLGVSKASMSRLEFVETFGEEAGVVTALDQGIHATQSGRGQAIAVRSEVQILRKSDNTKLAVTLSMSALGTGKHEREILVSFHDEGDKRRMDEIERRFVAIVESTEDAIIGRDSQGVVTSWNRGACNLFGFTEDEIIDKPINILFPPNFQAESDRIQRLIEKGESLTSDETVCRRKDGSLIQVSLRIAPLRDDQGDVHGATIIARNETEYKKAGDSLREQTHLLDSAQAFIRDLNSRILFWPKSAEKLYGYSSQEAVGALSHDLLRTHFPKPLEEIFKELFDTDLWEGELSHKQRDGQSIVVHSTWALHRNKEGEPISILENNIDITDRKRTEVLLAEQAEQLAQQTQRLEATRIALETQTSMLQSVLNSMSEGLIVTDSNGQFTVWNPAAEQIVGLSASNVPKEEWGNHYGLFLPDKKTPFPADQNPLFLAMLGKETSAEMYILNRGLKAGKFLEVNASPLRDGRGTIKGGVTAFRDISERVQMDEVRMRLVAIIESSEDAIVGKDIFGIMTSWNKGAEKIFGYSSAEMIGKSITILLPQDREFEEDDILRRIRAGETVEHFETIRQRKDGKLLHMSLTISPIKDSRGRIVGASKIARDISETKKLERQLLQSQKMDAIGQLTGGIAHDFNNLLGIIIGNLDLLGLFLNDTGAASSQVEAAQRAASRCADLTRRLLAFSRMEELRPASTLLNSAICNTIALVKRALGPDITITTTLDDSLPRVFVDVTGLESALINLIVNARDALPTGGVIAVSTKLVNLEETYANVKLGQLKAGWYGCATVSDTGMGMSPETLDRAFEPFFTTKALGKGTGLGLAMVYGFAKQSGGAVRIYSELGKGTTVSMYLPLVESESDNTVTTVGSPEQSSLNGTVLIVDDEKDLLNVAARYLSDLGLIALIAEDAATALEVVKREKAIDLVITDIVMPRGMNGVQLAQKLRQMAPHIKLIYSSGFPADGLAARRLALIEGPLLHKPYQRAEFNAVVRKVLRETNGRPFEM